MTDWDTTDSYQDSYTDLSDAVADTVSSLDLIGDMLVLVEDEEVVASYGQKVLIATAVRKLNSALAYLAKDAERLLAPPPGEA